MTGDRAMQDSRGQKVLWGLGAVIAGGVVPYVLLVTALGMAMAVIVVLRLGQFAGVAAYLLALAAGLGVYAAVIHVTIRTVGRRSPVPWCVWPGLAVSPVLWLGFATVGDPAGVYEPGIAVPALIGLTIAFVTLGEHRWTAVA